MIRSFNNVAKWLSVAVFAAMSTVATAGAQVYARPVAQPTATPLMQPIIIVSDKTRPAATPTPKPLIKPTGDVTPVTAPASSGYAGIIVETIDGRRLVDNLSNYAFNPASNVKVATSYAVIKTFGPDFRFATSIYTDGTLDKQSGQLTGNLYVAGRDPMFNLEHGILLAQELNKLGIRSVTGSVVVTETFSMNYNMSSSKSAATLLATLDMTRRSANATKAWYAFLNNSGRGMGNTGTPSVSVAGGAFVQPIPGNLKHLFMYESAPIKEVIKATMCFSNNFLAERLGDMLGGAQAVANTVHLGAGVAASEFQLKSSSGLGTNRVTPNAMMRLLRALRSELQRNNLSFSDIMPVAGVDDGTLEHRFSDDFARGSLVGKTGTLPNTDNGVSTLCGEIATRNGGRMLFVIFNQGGNVSRFRSFQNTYMANIQNMYGGPASLQYNQVGLDQRLAKVRISYPESRARIN